MYHEPMIHIDGAQHSGSGTVVRFAVALAALTRQPLQLFNARLKRDTPGLRPQHLAAVRACAELCGAQTEGLAVGSREFTFRPGTAIRGGDYTWDIGTAGSTTMLTLGILPLACFADGPVTARITGGVFQDFAPSPHHCQHVLVPLLRRMGADVELRVLRPGYVPRGGGLVELRVHPVSDALHRLELTEQGDVCALSGIALASHLAERRVSERMARACEAALAAAGLRCTIERIDDTAATHPGASLALWAETSTGCVLGADRAGAPRRSSEAIGRFVAASLLDDLATGGTMDRHAADQIALFAALAAGTTTYIAPRITDHVDSTLWLAEQFGATVRCDERWIAIDGIGRRR